MRERENMDIASTRFPKYVIFISTFLFPPFLPQLTISWKFDRTLVVTTNAAGTSDCPQYCKSFHLPGQPYHSVLTELFVELSVPDTLLFYLTLRRLGSLMVFLANYCMQVCS
jgi:hypothetical protein